ncbi:MAG: S1C family serine protease [Actinomycetota bacterium]|nr:trypsin-like peptidase domain-containing protein [Acidimicrobiia bacterium]MDQ3293796.1 S1C family serine protease [Actinomycetota bacterium]
MHLPGEHGDDADDDLPPSAPLPPDDRLWRHPSEVAWSAPPPRAAAAAASTSTPRLWAIALTSGLSGAVLALGVVTLVSGLGGVREVVERVPLTVEDASIQQAGATSGPMAVAARMSPSIVRLEVASDTGLTTGSGIVMRSDGTILTNAHVLDGARTITVILSDGMGYEADLVGSDVLSDVAVVRVVDGDGAPWVPAVLGTAEGLVVGEEAVAIGSPLGLAGPPSVTVGVISALGRRVTSPDGVVLHDMIQTDAPIARGSSGGALCDGNGVVIGLTTARAAAEGGDLGFATPIDMVKSVAAEILGTGAVHNVWLGIEGADLPATDMSLPGVAGAGGAQVHLVTEGGPAAEGGLLDGDVVVAVDGRRIASMSALVVALRRYEPGDVVVLEVNRAGQLLQLSVILAER